MPILCHQGEGGRQCHRSAGGSLGDGVMKCERKGRAGTESWATLAFRGVGEGARSDWRDSGMFMHPCVHSLRRHVRSTCSARRCARLWALSHEQSSYDPCSSGAQRPTEVL